MSRSLPDALSHVHLTLGCCIELFSVSYQVVGINKIEGLRYTGTTTAFRIGSQLEEGRVLPSSRCQYVPSATYENVQLAYVYVAAVGSKE